MSSLKSNPYPGLLQPETSLVHSGSLRSQNLFRQYNHNNRLTKMYPIVHISVGCVRGLPSNSQLPGYGTVSAVSVSPPPTSRPPTPGIFVSQESEECGLQICCSISGAPPVPHYLQLLCTYFLHFLAVLSTS